MLQTLIRYLVDTDWVIHALNEILSFTHRLEELFDEGIGISIISMAELYQGVLYSYDPQASESRLSGFLTGYDVVQLDDDICRTFGRERGRLRAAGTPISDLDLLIGCTALRHGLTLLSNNRRHFGRLQGLDIVSVGDA